jgi:MFS family permease
VNREKRLALTTASVPLLLGALDFLGVAVAIPSIQRHFSATFLDLRLILVAYWVPDLLVLILSGRLSDAWGHRRLLITGFSTSQ